MCCSLERSLPVSGAGVVGGAGAGFCGCSTGAEGEAGYPDAEAAGVTVNMGGYLDESNTVTKQPETYSSRTGPEYAALRSGV